MTPYILKRDGRREKFRRDKIIRTCRRAGASEKTARKVAEEVERKIYDGITTDKVLALVIELLNEYEYSKGFRYDLKSSLLRLGPSGFGFEKFVARLLEEYGYKTRTNVYIDGKCVTHEIDVTADAITDRNVRYLIECKFHNLPIYTGLKEVMYTHARFLDILENRRNCKAEGIWLFTNTKFSEDAKRYASCRRIKLTGWNYPEGESIENLLEKKNLYPLSILKIEKVVLDKLVNANYIFCRDVIEGDLKEIKRKTGLSLKEIRKVAEEAKLVLG
ncbi:MAG: restriction endonuclease [Archaeoglobus sp.]|nr:restriction endonuclease [Archaeoglobus sp.]